MRIAPRCSPISTRPRSPLGRCTGSTASTVTSTSTRSIARLTPTPPASPTPTASSYSPPRPSVNSDIVPTPRDTGSGSAWMHTDFDDHAWSTTDPCLQTWSSLGLHDYMGAMWYRASVELPAIPAGKRVYLWLAATDGSARLFVNGRHIPYANERRDAEGKATTTTADAFSGYAAPASFDITAAIAAGPESTHAAVRATRAE